MTLSRIIRLPRLAALLAAGLIASGAMAAPGGAPGPGPSSVSAATQVPAQPAQPAPPADPGLPHQNLTLSATFAGGEPIRDGLVWRVFPERADNAGSRALVAQSQDARPVFSLPDGDYIVHAAYGLAGVTRRVSINGAPASETLAFNAGALRIVGVLGDARIPPNRETIAIYVPQPGNSEAKLVVANARPGEVIGLPEGAYHLVSTYLDTVGVGSLNASATPKGIPTNSVVNADVRVPGGKLLDVTLRHHAATLTIKLVNHPGGEALANTNFTVLTPGGDVIRELIGAFPSLVLAEGEYVVIARHEGKTYQSTFTVQSAVDRDIEVIAK